MSTQLAERVKKMSMTHLRHRCGELSHLSNPHPELVLEYQMITTRLKENGEMYGRVRG